MKKVSLLILLVLVVSTLLTAAVPTKMVRLTIINKSGYDVFIKLEGSELVAQYYYLTIPSGSRDQPYIKVFTIMSDLYARTTWTCEGARNTGQLFATGNIRLTFLPCGEFACARTWDWSVIRPYINRCGNLYTIETLKRIRAGEPTMEKVTWFRWLAVGAPSWSAAYLYNGFYNLGCATYYFRLRTYRLPVGCQWRYQY